MWNVARTRDQVMEGMNSMIDSNSSGLIGLWRGVEMVDDSTAVSGKKEVVRDLSGNQPNG